MQTEKFYGELDEEVFAGFSNQEFETMMDSLSRVLSAMEEKTKNS